ncbi:MAG TPA: C39 family peptidase [Candidatus Saccharimonadales bacterium]|nr:C39 family peptidase [Candidatus Saccharimonadales bacterium]
MKHARRWTRIVKRVGKKVKQARKIHLHKWWLIGSALGIASLSTGAVFGLRATEAAVTTQLAGNQIVSVSAPLTFHISQDLQVDDAEVLLSPHSDVSYHFAKGAIGQTDLIVTPHKVLKSNQDYSLEIKNIRHFVSRRKVPTQTVHFRTELAPGIASFTPGNSQVTRDVVFTMVATDHQTALRAYNLTLEPKAEVQASFDGHNTLRWKPIKPLQQGTTYKVKLTANQLPLQETTLAIVSEPKITAATAKDHFYPGEKITVTFDKPMRTDEKEMPYFPLPGHGEWQNDTTYIFTPDKLEPNKSYTYLFRAGFTSQDGGMVEADRSFTVQTPGPSTVVNASPWGSNLRRTVPIQFTFDQPVDHASAQSHFRISPAAEGSFRWESNTLIYTPTGLEYQTTYTASIVPGVVATYGVPGTDTSSVRFATEVQTVKLNVPAFSQTYKLSCEAASLRMALAFYGVGSSDFDLVQRMGYTPRALTNGEWDDPYSQFVGDINGRQWDTSGYGAYAPPVAAAARSMGRGASAFFGVSAGFLAQQIHDGHPVIVWGYQHSPTPFSWHTSNGQVIDAWQGEHTRTVIGVVGRADAPLGFYVNDPATGGSSYWSAGSLMAQLNVRGSLSNQAVVVY